MYYSNTAQPHPHPVAAYQNLPDNMSVAGGPAAAGMVGAACETQQGQPYGLPPSSSPYSGAPPPMLNLAKVRTSALACARVGRSRQSCRWCGT